MKDESERDQWRCIVLISVFVATAYIVNWIQIAQLYELNARISRLEATK